MNHKKIFIVAGEASGDILGSQLVKDIKDAVLQEFSLHSGLNLQFKGIGGVKMQEVGVELVFHYSEIAVIGLTEVLMSWRKLKKRLKMAFNAVIDYRPDIIITIDSPGFNFRLVRKVRKVLGNELKAIHYVAPTVWAYGQHRARIITELYQHIMLILPFESEYFQNIPNTFVGHPITKTDNAIRTSLENAIKYDTEKIQQNKWFITVLPGSRKSEITRHMKVLLSAMFALNSYFSDRQITFYILTLPHLAVLVKRCVHNFYDKKNNLAKQIIIVEEDSKHTEIIRRSVVGITKCGTVTLSFMSNFIPSISFYKLSNITAWIMKRRLSIKNFNLCNIITGQNIVPELIQDDFTKENVFAVVTKTLTDNIFRQTMLSGYSKVWDELTRKKPADSAANIILKTLFANPP